MVHNNIYYEPRNGQVLWNFYIKYIDLMCHIILYHIFYKIKSYKIVTIMNKVNVSEYYENYIYLLYIYYIYYYKFYSKYK